jgi:hypothetical protein
MSVPALRIPISAKMEDFERDMGKARETSVRLLRAVAQQVIKFNQDVSAGQAAENWATNWGTAAARIGLAIGGIVVTVKAIGAVIEGTREQLAEIIAVADKAAARGTSPQFFQAFTAEARKMKVEAGDLESALSSAFQATKDVIKPDWTVWDTGLKKISAIEEKLREMRELFGPGQSFTGLDLFRNARDVEGKTLAVLTGMRELEAIGQKVAALDLADSFFGSKMADNIRLGKTSADELLGTISKFKSAGEGFGDDLVRQTKEADRALKEASETLNRSLKPQWDSLVEVANEIKTAWAGIVTILAKAVDLLNRADREGTNFLAGASQFLAAGALNRALGSPGGNAGAVSPDAGAAIGQMKARADERNPLSIGLGVNDIGGAPANVPLPLRRPSDAPKTPKDKKETEEAATAFETATDAINRNIAALEADAAAVGLTQGAHQQLRVELRLIEAARQSGVEITDEQIASYAKLRASMSAEQALAAAGITLEKDQAEQFGKLSERIRLTADMLDAKRKSFQGVNDAVRFAGNQLVDVIDRATQKGAKFGDIMSDVLRNVSRQLLQAAITGEGAFAKMLGLASNNGGVGGLGGLVSALFKGGAGSAAAGGTPLAGSLAIGQGGIGAMADGGVIPPGGLALVSEHSQGGGKLLRAPSNEPIMVTPHDVARSGNGGNVFAPVFQIDASGADQAAVQQLHRVLDLTVRRLNEMQRGLVSTQRFANTGVR